MRLYPVKILLVAVFLTPSAYSVECQWWQTKVSSHQVKRHQQKDKKVSAHLRQEHCREKWNGADKLIKLFKDQPIKGWLHKETFKNWKRTEIQTLIEILPSIPQWAAVEKYSFYRANRSIHKGNPATSEVTYGSIIIYDQFFNENNKASILVHESGHHLFKHLNASEGEEFASLSGWNEEVTKDRKVYIIPPKNLIKPDSVLSKEEVFTNHLEIYFINPTKYKQSYPKAFDFFQKRYPL